VIVSIIVAMDERGGIGIDNRLPWHLSADLKRFKALTMGHCVLMGRKTYESIGKPLPGRTMVVMTRQKDYQPEGCLVVHSLKEGMDLAEKRGENEAFVIGGGEIFTQALPIAARIYLTRVHAVAQCDVFFPEIDKKAWQEQDISHHASDIRNDFPFTFKTLVRQSALS